MVAVIPSVRVRGLNSIARVSRGALMVLVGGLGVVASAQVTVTWSNAFGIPPAGQGVDGPVRSLLDWTDPSGTHYLAVGGDFSMTGNTPASNFSLWDGTQWLGDFGGVSGGVVRSVLALADDTNQLLYVGGVFEHGGPSGTPLNSVAMFDGWSWHPLVDVDTGAVGVEPTPGFPAPLVDAVLTDVGSSGQTLVYVGGVFSGAGGKPANNVAVYDGQRWSNLGAGIPTWVYDLCFFDDGNGRRLYAATYAGVLRWEDPSWVAVGASSIAAPVYDLLVVDFNGGGSPPPQLIAGGKFTLTASATNNIASWDNAGTWQPMAGGLGSSSDEVRVLYEHHGCSEPVLVAGGLFDIPGGGPYEGVAGLIYGSWTAAQSSAFSGGAWVWALEQFDGPLPGVEGYVGGQFMDFGGHPASNLSASASCGAAPFPLVDEELVVTGEGWLGSDFVVTAIGTDAPRGPVGSNWDAPKFHNEIAPSAPTEIWNLENLGQVFGVCMDNATPPNIYVAATAVYDTDVFGPSGPGAVYKIDGATGDISEFAGTWPHPTLAPHVTQQFTTYPDANDLPNTGVGLGDVCFNTWTNTLYVSNFEDGKIYAFNANGERIDEYDPFLPDNGAPGAAPLGELLWAVSSPNGSLWFSGWLCSASSDMLHPLPPSVAWPTAWPPKPPGAPNNNTIFKVSVPYGQLPASGTMPDIARVMPVLTGHDRSNPVSDIAWRDCSSPFGPRFVVAERSMITPSIPSAHESRVLDAFLNQWSIGEYDNGASWTNGWNSTGGADINLAGEVVATGDLLEDAFPTVTYGVQIFPSGMLPPPDQTNASSWLIDLNNVLDGYQDKRRVGELEVCRPRFCGVPAGWGKERQPVIGEYPWEE